MDKLEIFEVKYSVLYLFKLKLKVLFNLPLNYVNKSSGVTKILQVKSFVLNLKQEFYLTLRFILVLVKTYLSIQKKDSK